MHVGALVRLPVCVRPGGRTRLQRVLRTRRYRKRARAPAGAARWRAGLPRGRRQPRFRQPPQGAYAPPADRGRRYAERAPSRARARARDCCQRQPSRALDRGRAASCSRACRAHLDLLATGSAQPGAMQTAVTGPMIPSVCTLRTVSCAPCVHLPMHEGARQNVWIPQSARACMALLCGRKSG
jgi:hypothetical protein